MGCCAMRSVTPQGLNTFLCGCARLPEEQLVGPVRSGGCHLTRDSPSNNANWLRIARPSKTGSVLSRTLTTRTLRPPDICSVRTPSTWSSARTLNRWERKVNCIDDENEPSDDALLTTRLCPKTVIHVVIGSRWVFQRGGFCLSSSPILRETKYLRRGLGV